MNKKSLLKLLVPIALILVMAGALPLFTGCMPGQTAVAPPPEPPPPCQCGGWDNVEVYWTDSSGASLSWTGNCGETVGPISGPISNPSGPITVNSSISCIPDDCSPDYTWEVTTYAGMSLPSPPSGSGLPAEFTPQGSGWNSYEVTLNASCDGVVCPPCIIYMRVETEEEECEPKMHYPQYPDVDGWDVYSCKSASLDEMIQAADDWKCSETGLVENIRFWGSWKDGVVGQITGFHIEIYSNIPEDGDYSHPGDLLWDAFITDYSSEAFELAAFEGWYNPWTGFHEDFDHNTYYQYDITDIQDAFWQEEGNIYWLSIWPVVDGYAVWGWKSSQDHFMDDACWSVHLPQTPAVDWKELYEPTPVVQSLDLAFIICGGEMPCQCGGWDNVEVEWFESDLPIPTGTWTGSCGETVTINHAEAAYKVSVSFGMNCINCSSPQPAYYWDITGPVGYSYSGGPSTTPWVSFPGANVSTDVGTYQVVLNAECDGVVCPPCIIYIRVETEEECEPKMHYPQYPDEDGWDVRSAWIPQPFGEDVNQLADDWKCFESGPVTDIRFWGSWYEDEVGDIPGFYVEIYDNIPESTYSDYSQPGDKLWDAYITDYTSELIRSGRWEGYYDPSNDVHYDEDHTTYYRYDITDIPEPFYQEEGRIYWLSIVPDISDGEPFWGWKSSQDHFMDDACWRAHSGGTPSSDWYETYEPTAVVQSLDLAFVICGGEAPCQCRDWEDVAVTWADESGIPQSWTGSCGEVVSPAPTICSGTSIEVNTGITCEPSPPCEPSYEWKVTEVGPGPPLSESGTTLPASFTPTPAAVGWNTFEVVLNASCDGVECPPCIITMRVNVVPCEECECRGWEELTISSGDWQEAVSCGETINTPLDVGAWVEVTASYICTPPEDCVATYAWEVPELNIDGTCDSSPCVFGFELPDECVKVYVSTFCGGTLCDECTFAICPCECEGGEVSLPVCRCNVDDFGSPTPSDALEDWIDANYNPTNTYFNPPNPQGHIRLKPCDDETANRYWAHTFTDLCVPCCHIERAYLEITVKNNHGNDSLRIGFIDSDTATWDYSRELDLLGVPVGATSTITLDLSSLPHPSGNVNLLPTIEEECFLDVVVQDDSTVDCAELRIIYGP